MREIQIHFGNEEKSQIWVKEIQTRSVEQLRKLTAALNTLSDENRDAAFDALQALMRLLGDVIVTQAKAMEALKNEIPAAIEAIASFDAREKARKRIEKDADGKQAAKAAALKLWQEWQRGDHLHTSGAAFHRHVCSRLPAITSTKTVERWCVKWRKAAAIGTEAAASPLD